MEGKEKHLEFIQSVVGRMAKNSFLIKGWTITLVSGFIAFSIKESKTEFIIAAILPLVVFWILDAYYLFQERLYRKLFDEIRTKDEVDFSMDVTHLKSKLDWLRSFFSKTQIIFFGSTLSALVLMLIIF